MGLEEKCFVGDREGQESDGIRSLCVDLPTGGGLDCVNELKEGLDRGAEGVKGCSGVVLGLMIWVIEVAEECEEDSRSKVSEAVLRRKAGEGCGCDIAGVFGTGGGGCASQRNRGDL